MEEEDQQTQPAVCACRYATGTKRVAWCNESDHLRRTDIGAFVEHIVASVRRLDAERAGAPSDEEIEAAFYTWRETDRGITQDAWYAWEDALAWARRLPAVAWPTDEP